MAKYYRLSKVLEGFDFSKSQSVSSIGSKNSLLGDVAVKQLLEKDPYDLISNFDMVNELYQTITHYKSHAEWGKLIDNHIMPAFRDLIPYSTNDFMYSILFEILNILIPDKNDHTNVQLLAETYFTYQVRCYGRDVKMYISPKKELYNLICEKSYYLCHYDFSKFYLFLRCFYSIKPLPWELYCDVSLLFPDSIPEGIDINELYIKDDFLHVDAAFPNTFWIKENRNGVKYKLQILLHNMLLNLNFKPERP